MTASNRQHRKNQRYPSAEELSEIISLEIEKIEKAIQGEAHVSSIDAPITEDEGTTMADMLSSSSEYASDCKVNYDSMCSDLMQVLCTILNDRERTIVIQSFGIGCPERALDAIGDDLGLTRERVRQRVQSQGYYLNTWELPADMVCHGLIWNDKRVVHKIHRRSDWSE